MELIWKYFRIGECQFCGNDDTRLYTLVEIDFRTVTKPLFCPTCQIKFEFFLKTMKPLDILQFMNRKRD